MSSLSLKKKTDIKRVIIYCTLFSYLTEMPRKMRDVQDGVRWNVFPTGFYSNCLSSGKDYFVNTITPHGRLAYHILSKFTFSPAILARDALT